MLASGDSLGLVYIWDIVTRQMDFSVRLGRKLYGIFTYIWVSFGGYKCRLGGGFQYVLFSPLFGEDFQFD